MQASHYAIRAHALIVLYELYAVAQDGCNGVVEVSLGEALKEVSSGIAKDFWLYYHYAINGGLYYVDHISYWYYFGTILICNAAAQADYQYFALH